MVRIQIMKKITAPITAALAAFLLVGCSSTPEVDTDPAPADEVEVEEVIEEAPDEGTRENPYPLGSEITDGDWTVVINSVNLDATDAIVGHNEFNEPPEDGNIYILVEATVTYNGTDPQGEVPMTTIDYVTADGNTIDIAWVDYAETDFTLLDPLYEGASHTGSNAYEVPADTAAEGVLAVAPDMMSDRVFVAVQ